MVHRELPLEHEDRPEIKVTLTPIVFAMLFVFCLNVALVAVGFTTPLRHEDQLLRAKWALATASETQFDWVVVGDSSASLGIDPTVLSGELGGRAVNLATFGSMGLTGDCWITDEYLRHHKAPRGIIVVHAAEVWGGGRSEAFYQYAASIPEPAASLVIRLISIRSTPSELLYCFRYRGWLPLLLIKDHAREVLGWSKGTHDPAPSSLDLPADGTIRLDQSAGNPVQVEQHARDYWSAFHSSVPELGRERRSLQRLLERAAESGVPTYLANGPIVDQVADASDFDERTTVIKTEVAQLVLERHLVSNMTDLWFRFPSNQMENANHIVGAAVDRYTTELAQSIKSGMRQSE